MLLKVGFSSLLVQNTEHELEQLCSFLGLSTPAEERERITKGVHFDVMKQNNMTNHSSFSHMDFKISPFMRKGSYAINKECGAFSNSRHRKGV